MKEQFEHESLLPEEKKCFERSEFIQSQNVYVNLLPGFPASSNRSLPMRCRVFCNLADKSGNHDIHGQNKLPNVAIQVRRGEGKGGGGWTRASFQTRSRHF